jgi:hypothetical protein
LENLRASAAGTERATQVRIQSGAPAGAPEMVSVLRNQGLGSSTTHPWQFECRPFGAPNYAGARDQACRVDGVLTLPGRRAFVCFGAGTGLSEQPSTQQALGGIGSTEHVPVPLPGA